MSYNYCNHSNNAVNIPSDNVITSTEDNKCSKCDYSGPKLWICLYQNCAMLGCSDELNNHSTLHFTANPKHFLHMNVLSRRIWCYLCNAEKYILSLTDRSGIDKNVEVYPEKATTKQEIFFTNGSVRGTLYSFEKNDGMNLGSEGSSSDSSDIDDTEDMVLDKPAGLVGLLNIGNTCYMNAALQALSNAAPLTRFFLDCSATVQFLSEGKNPRLSRTYQSLMQDIWIKKNGGYVSASGILHGIRIAHPMFRGYHQHDTQEFLRNFMDQLHEELKQQCQVDSRAPIIEEITVSSSYDSSEGEYETCDSGVSERSSLSDDAVKPASNIRCSGTSVSPGRRLRARLHNSEVVDCQSATASCSSSNISPTRKYIKYRSIISDIFDGTILSSVQCLTCKRISSRVETFQDVSLPIPSRDHLILIHGRGVPSGSNCSESVIPVQDGWIAWILQWLKSWFYGPTITLHDCLAAFFSTDELKGDNMYSCERCSKLRNGIKFSKVLQLPEVLCIHLKRFRNELMFSSKISSSVNFPLKGLEMKPYLHKNCISKITNYELFSVICHHGTAGGGHYITFALNNGEWYEFDDQYVTEVLPEKVENCEAYVLFYRKSTLRADETKMKVINMSEMYNDEKEIAYVSKQWMNRFNTCAEPGPIDNSDFLCQHRFMNPDTVLILMQLSIIVPLTVYEYLHKVYGGCPPVTCVHVCPSCQTFNKRRQLEMETFFKLTTESQNRDDSATHLLSLVWYNQWHNFVTKKLHESPGAIDNSKITTNQINKNECVGIPEVAWNFFYKIYGGGPEIRIIETCLKISDNENNIDEKVKETDFRVVRPNMWIQDIELDDSGKEKVADGGSDKELEEYSLESIKCRSKVSENMPSVTHSNFFTSKSSDNKSNFSYENENFQESCDSNRKELKL